MINLSRTLVIDALIVLQIFLGFPQITGSDTTIGNSASETTEFVTNYATGSPEVAESTSSELTNTNNKTVLEVERRCQPNPCVRGNCYEKTGTWGETTFYTYTCSCFEGYKGENCSQRDRCKLDGGDAFCNQAKCTMDYEKDSFFCNCSAKEYFDYNWRVCKSLDLCPLKTCNAHELCENNTCVCERGYKPNIKTGECEVDFCNAFGCPGQGMICDDSESYFPEEVKCSCKSGEAFDGISCKSAHCSFPDLNNCSQLCSQGEDNFKCGCFPDYEISEDKSACELSGNGSVECPNETCDFGVCIEIEGRPKCFCPTAYGYVEQDGECIDLCTAGKLNGMCPENKCEVLDTEYRCKCTGKFKLSDDETTCTVRKLCAAGEIGHSECAKRNAVCKEDYNSAFGYNCSCADGFIETDAFECKKVCDIEDNQKHCDNLGAICYQNSFNSSDFDCKCPPLFRSSVPGGPCNKYENRSKTDSTVIVAAVLGGILLITLILFVATVTRLRQKRNSDYDTQVLYTAGMTERQHQVRVFAANSAFERLKNS